LHVKSQCLEGEVVATRNGVYSASTEIQDLRRLTKKAAELGNNGNQLHLAKVLPGFEFRIFQQQFRQLIFRGPKGTFS